MNKFFYNERYIFKELYFTSKLTDLLHELNTVEMIFDVDVEKFVRMQDLISSDFILSNDKKSLIRAAR